MGGGRPEREKGVLGPLHYTVHVQSFLRVLPGRETGGWELGVGEGGGGDRGAGASATTFSSGGDETGPTFIPLLLIVYNSPMNFKISIG